MSKVDKSKLRKEVILEQNKGYIEFYKLNCLTAKPISGGSNLSQRTFKWGYPYNFETFFNSYQKLYKGKSSCENNDSTILETFDVKNLYTSILHNYGIVATYIWIERHQQTLHQRFLREFVLKKKKKNLKTIIVRLTVNFINN